MKPMLQLNHIYKSYYLNNKPIPVLQDINLTVDKGDMVSIIGASGSGKTTLLNLIGLLDIPDKGEYFFNGIKINNCRERKLTKLRNEKIGFVFQNFYLLQHLTAFENVELPLIYRNFPKKTRNKLVTQALETVDLLNRKNHKPNELSGGQKQRIAIARAIALNPPVILADEPTGNLDPKSVESVMHYLKQLNMNGTTVLFITHDTELTKYSNKTITVKAQ